MTMRTTRLQDCVADGPLAVLPMYDWPEVRAETDALWAAVRFHLLAADIAAPTALARDAGTEAAWLSDDLVLGQTCGLPYVTVLRHRVHLLGTPVYRLEGCPPGDYRSVLVVATDSRARTIADLRGTRAAYNMTGSQSGYAALCAAAAPCGGVEDLFAARRVTGSHRASIVAVADGAADVAAIDAVSWELARRYEPAAARLRVLGHTSPTPGLPLITARRRAGLGPAICGAVETAIAGLDKQVREVLLLDGFRRRQPTDYDGIAAAAAARGVAPTPVVALTDP